MASSSGRGKNMRFKAFGQVKVERLICAGLIYLRQTEIQGVQGRYSEYLNDVIAKCPEIKRLFVGCRLQKQKSQLAQRHTSTACL